MTDEIKALQAKIKFDVDRLAALKSVGETIPHNDAPVIFFYKKLRGGTVKKETVIRKSLNRWRVFYGTEGTGQFAAWSNDATWSDVTARMLSGDDILTRVEYLGVNGATTYHVEES